MSQMSRAFMSREAIAQVGSDYLGALLSGALEQGIYEESVTQRYELGSRRAVNNGGVTRVFYYGRVHPLIGVGFARGRVMMASDDGSERGAFLGAQTAGAYTVTWTTVEAVVADQFRNGFLLAQGGWVYEIAHNTAGGIGAVITLTLFDPIAETIAAGRNGLIQENPYANLYNRGNNVVNTERAGCVMGVSLRDMTAAYYGWFQTWGPGPVMVNNLGLGDELAGTGEHELHIGINPGDECQVATGDGFQPIGNILIANAVCTDGENWVIADLKIRP
jgi:hypothetical protein